MEIVTKRTITPRDIADLMVTALEGGIGYWCGGVYLMTPDEAEFKAQPGYKGPWYDNESLYSMPDLKIKVTELEDSDDNEGIHYIGLKEIERAFVLMQQFGKPPGWHWQNFINDNSDSETADVWFQLSVFKEVVYG